MKKTAILLVIALLFSFGETFAAVTVCDDYHKTLFYDNFNNDTEPPLAGMKYILGGAKCELLEEADRGKIVRFPEQEGKRLYINYKNLYEGYEQVNEETAKLLQNVKCEVDLKLTDGATARINALNYDGFGAACILAFLKGNIYLLDDSGTKIGTYDSDWHSYKIEIDAVENLINIYKDGALLRGGVSAPKLEKETRGIISFGVYGRRDESTGYIWVDNIKMTSKNASPGINFEGDLSGNVTYPLLADDGEKAYLFTVFEKDGEVFDIKYESASSAETHQRLSIPFEINHGEMITSYSFTLKDGKFQYQDKKINKPVTDKDFDDVAENFRVLFIEGVNNDLTDPDVSARVAEITAKGKAALDIMDMTEGATVLFKKVSEITTTGQMSAQFDCLYNMARAYGVEGGELSGNEDLKDKILYAIDWLYENLYGEDEINGTGWHSTSGYNWYDWYIDSPTSLMKTMFIMREHLEDEDIKKYLSLFNYIRQQMRTSDSYAHIFSRSNVCTLYAVLTKNTELLTKTVTQTNKLMQPVTSGIGYRADGTFMFHTAHPYTSFYGINFLDSRIIPLYMGLSGTAFHLDDENYNLLLKHIKDTYMPVTFKGKMFASLMGRGATGTDEASQGGRGINVVMSLYMIAKDEDKPFLKDYIVRNSPGGYAYAKKYVSMDKLRYLKEIFADNPVPEDYTHVKVYYDGDRAIWQKNGNAVVISMSSERTYDYESINGDNKKGWYLGDGATYVYSGENYANQFSAKSWWKVINRAHLPGTTETIRAREALSFSKAYLRPVDFVGGVSHNNEYAVVAFDFKGFTNSIEPEDTDYSGYGGDFPIYESDLSAKKSWFLFDNEIVALGSNVKTTDGYETRTYVTNYRLATDEQVKKGDNWVRYTKGAGYYFPQGVPVEKADTSNSLHEMWINHGTDPTNGKYAYVILPDVTSDAEISAYSVNPDIEILLQNDFVHAVKEKNTGVTGYVFWRRGTYSDLTVSSPCVLTISETEIKAADPTHKLDILNVTYKGKTYVFDMSGHTGETLSKIIKN